MKDVIKRIDNINYAEEKIGEVVIDACFNDESGGADDIGRYLISLIERCETEKEFKLVNETVIAITGNSIKTILDTIEERDKDHFIWETVYEEEEELW